MPPMKSTLTLSEKLIRIDKVFEENGLVCRELKIERKEHEDEDETNIWLNVGVQQSADLLEATA